VETGPFVADQMRLFNSWDPANSKKKTKVFVSRITPAAGLIFETKNRAIFSGEPFSGEEFLEQHYCPYNFVPSNWLWSGFIFPELEHL